MIEPNELRSAGLEKRVTEIEEYLGCNKGAKEQQWKTNLNSKLGNIEDMVKAVSERQVRTAWQWLFSLGVSAMAVGLTWVIATMPRTPGDLRTGLFVFSIGLVISLLSLFYRYRKKS